uniref:Hexosyltransferase n=1 Tax=Panagrolaimus superbus TaxID=310955 RepID=A0A914ZHP1_9BILA
MIVTNLRDTYLNGTLKAYALLQWQQHFCPKIKYLLKADDDVVADIPRLQYWIKKDFYGISKKHNFNTIFCKVIKNGTPLRNSNKKW